MSLPALAPLVTLVVLVELATGTASLVLLGDLCGDVHRGFVGTTALICLGLMGTALGVAAILPDPSSLLHAQVEPSRQAALVHWGVGFATLLAVHAFFSAVGTDAARRVVGGLTVACGVGTLANAARAYGGALGATPAALGAFFPAALLGGAALGGMLLGHWYLIAPDQSFRPLRRAVGVVFVAVAVQASTLAVALAVASPGARHSLLAGRYGVFFWLLVVATGLLFTTVVNSLTLYFARIRANQPATAMLYALIVSVLMGIVPAHLLLFLTGVAV